ncbi:MAG TPA: prephenate dehydrogenase/arogenate dehydrogenase family protein [Longimicrobiaceae bacterium]|nr:prephenate dehydrogenase/arogenate dehydrogenase family protein [Longimicrobiaceae bacterium]
MTTLRTVAVAGLGLIGGSAARDLARRGVRVLGFDRDASTVAAAVREDVVAAALGPALEGVEEADVLLIALPVLAALALLEAALPRLGSVRLVTDAGSTKRSIVAAAERLGVGPRFVGAHPLAGHHRCGWEASRAGLFAGARVYLCPTRETTGDAVDHASRLWSLLGGVPEVVDAAEHDRRLAWTSHLPQAVATALAGALAARGVGRDELGPGGREMTRLAASSPQLWRDIVLDNADAIAEALGALEDGVRAARLAASAGDAEAILRLFAAGCAWAGEVPASVAAPGGAG